MLKRENKTEKSIDWEIFDPAAYCADNYQILHGEDRQIMSYLVDVYSSIPRARRGVEVGVGPNLYPLLAMLPFTDTIDVIDFSMRNLEFLGHEIADPSANWDKYWEYLREVDTIYHGDYQRLLTKKTRLQYGSVFRLPGGTYDCASMHFCAESITDDMTFFVEACLSFIGSVVSGGSVVASFMENSRGYSVAGIDFPAVAVNSDILENIFTDHCNQLDIKRIPRSAQPLREGYSGMLFLSGVVK